MQAAAIKMGSPSKPRPLTCIYKYLVYVSVLLFKINLMQNNLCAYVIPKHPNAYMKIMPQHPKTTVQSKKFSCVSNNLSCPFINRGVNAFLSMIKRRQVQDSEGNLAYNVPCRIFFTARSTKYVLKVRPTWP